MKGNEKNLHFPHIKNRSTIAKGRKVNKSLSTKKLPELTANIIKDVNQSIETTFREIEKIEKSLHQENSYLKMNKNKKKYSKYKTQITEDQSIKIEEEIQREDIVDKTLKQFLEQVHKQKQYFRKKSKMEEYQPTKVHCQRVETKESEDSLELKKKQVENKKLSSPGWKINYYMNKSRNMLDSSLEDEMNRLAMYERKNENSLEKYLENRRKLLTLNVKKSVQSTVI